MASKFNRLRISKFARASRVNLVVFALLFASVGAYLILNSFAAINGTGTVTVNVNDYYPSGTYKGPSSGALVKINNLDATGTYKCRQTYPIDSPTWSGTTYATTTSTGYVKFTCNSSDTGSGKTYSLENLGKTDYYPPAGATYSVVVANGGNYSVAMKLTQTDTDGDGIGNIDDDCDGTAGVSRNKGCPAGSLVPNSLIVAGGATSVPANTSFNMTWSGNSYLSNCSVSPKPGVIGTSGTFTVSGGISGTTIFTLSCSQSQVSGNAADNSPLTRQVTISGGGGGCTAPKIMVNGVCVDPPINATFIKKLSASPTKVNSGAKTTLDWEVSGQKCYMSYTNGSTSAQVAVNSAGPWTSPALTKATTFTLSCSGINGGNGASQSVGVTINGSSTPPPKPKPPVTTTTSSASRTVKRSGGTVSTGADKTKPSVPGNFVAEQFGSGEVDLSWDASSDSSGIDVYILERSTDQTNWTTLDDAISDTSYVDSTADFNTTYTYRLSAKDTVGNYSDYALVDITTNDFTANVIADQESLISSEDGLVEITIPAGSFETDAFCEISKDSPGSTPKGYKLVAGAYTVACRDNNGDSQTSFGETVKVVMHLKSYQKKYGTIKAYTVDDNSTSPIEAVMNKNTGDLSFSMNELQTFAAFGAKKSSPWWMWILFPLIIIGLILLIIRIRNSSGGGSDDYYDTANYVTMPPSSPVTPTDPSGYQHHPSLPELVAQGQQPVGQPPVVPGGQPPQYPPQPGPGPGQQLPQ